MENYGDVGYYAGEFKCNYPHGQGKKVYINGDVYEGQWELGRRHGIGTYQNNGKKYIFLFKKGVPKRLLDHTEIFDSEYTEIAILIPFICKQKGEYYVEEYQSDCNLKDCIYYMYYSKLQKSLSFKGKVFTKKLENLVSIKENDYFFTGEASAIINSYGFIEISSNYLTYVGYANKQTPNGKGKIFCRNYEISSDFVSGKINGKCTLKCDEERTEYFFDKGLDNNEIVVFKDNLILRFYVNPITNDLSYYELRSDYMEKIKASTRLNLILLTALEEQITLLRLAFNFVVGSVYLCYIK